jgi:lambda family phage tail tape measure protein
MANTSRTIEILLQLKSLGVEAVKALSQDIKNIAPAAASAASGINEFGKQAGASFAQVKGELVSFSSAMKSAGEGSKGALGTLEAKLDSIKSKFGSRSLLKDVLEVAVGGGIVGALGFAAQQVELLSAKLADLGDNARKGEGGLSEFAGDALRSLPVFGSLVKTFDNLREAITGEGVEIAKTDAETKAANDRIDAWIASKKAASEATAVFAENVRTLRQQLTLLQTPADQQAQVKAQQDLDNHLRALAKGFVDVANAKDFAFGIKSATEFENKLADLTAKVKAQQEAYQAIRVPALVPTIQPQQLEGTFFAGRAGNESEVAAAQAAADAAKNKLDDLKAQLEKAKELGVAYEKLKEAQKVSIDISDATRYRQLIGNVVTGWNNARDAVIAYGQKAKDADRQLVGQQALALIDQAKQLKESLQAPAEKLAEAKKSLQTLFDAGVVSPELYAKAIKQIDGDFSKSQADQVIAADQAHVAIAEGIEKLRAQAKLSYDSDVAAFMEAQRRKEAGGGGLTAAESAAGQASRYAQYQKQLAAIDQQAADQRLITQDQVVVALARGVDRQVASAKLQYDQDVINWRSALQSKLIDQSQFDALAAKGAADLAEVERQADQQKVDAQNQLQLLVLKSQHRTNAASLAQIRIDADAQLETWRESYEQGLVDWEQYNEARTAILKQASEKQTEIQGTFLDGMQQGVQDANDKVKTQAQLGREAFDILQDDAADAFGDFAAGAKSAKEAFKEFVTSFLSDIARMFAKNAVYMAFGLIGNLFGGIGTSIAGLFKPSAPAGGLTGIADGFHGINKGGLIAPFNFGGLVSGLAGFAGGGMVGSAIGPDRDSVLAALTLGEYVIKRRAVQAVGVPFLDAINSGILQPRLTAPEVSAAQAMRNGRDGDGGVTVVPAVVASERTMRTLLDGGGNALIDFLRSNATKARTAMGVRG